MSPHSTLVNSEMLQSLNVGLQQYIIDVSLSGLFLDVLRFVGH